MKFFLSLLLAVFIFSYGTQINWMPSWCAEDMKQGMAEIEVRSDRPMWNFGIVGQQTFATISPGHIIDGKYYDGNYNSLAIHSRLSFQKRLNPITWEVFGGLGYLVNHSSQPEWGDSGCLGHFGLSCGIEIHKITVKYGLSHYSDPLQHHDFGRNYQSLVFKYNF